MCIMEVRLGQRDSTIAQALAHNIGTVLSDIELFRPVLKARHPEMLGVLDRFQAELSTTSRSALNLWARLIEATVAAEGADHHTHVHEHAGSERGQDCFLTPASREDAAYGTYTDDDYGDVVQVAAMAEEQEMAEERVAAQDMARASNYETRK
jgi:hypothetical protein